MATTCFFNTHTHANSNAISLLSSVYVVSVGFGSAEFICYCNLIPMPMAQAARAWNWRRRRKLPGKIDKNYYKSTAQTITTSHTNGNSITQHNAVSRRSLYLHCVNIHQTTKTFHINKEECVCEAQTMGENSIELGTLEKNAEENCDK